MEWGRSSRVWCTSMSFPRVGDVRIDGRDLCECLALDSPTRFVCSPHGGYITLARDLGESADAVVDAVATDLESLKDWGCTTRFVSSIVQRLLA